MSADTPRAPSASVWSCAQAELLKPFAMRLPQIAYPSIFAFVYLFVFQFYHLHNTNEFLARQGHQSMYYALGPLLFFINGRMLFRLFILSLAIYLTLCDSQAGMIRVTTVHPLGRVSLALCRLASVVGHAALLALVYYLSLVVWTSAYSGFAGVGFGEIFRMSLSCCYTIIQTASLAAIAFALSLFWRSLAAGIMGVFSSLLAYALFLITVEKFVTEGESPWLRLLSVMWSSVPMQLLPLPDHWLWMRSYQVVPVEVHLTFLASAVFAPLVLCIPALWHFSRRDITE